MRRTRPNMNCYIQYYLSLPFFNFTKLTVAISIYGYHDLWYLDDHLQMSTCGYLTWKGLRRKIGDIFEQLSNGGSKIDGLRENPVPFPNLPEKSHTKHLKCRLVGYLYMQTPKPT